MAKLISICLLIFVINILLATEIQSQQQRIDTDPSYVVTRAGEKVNLLCRSSEPIVYCRITVPGEDVFNLSPQWPSKVKGFSYYGTGFEKGQCGITIDNVKESNNGRLKCFVGVQGTEISGNIDITIAAAPIKPELELMTQGRNGAYETDTEFRAKCIVRDGRPAANITWFLDDQPIYDGLGIMEYAETVNRDKTTLITSSQILSRFLQSEDDHRTLICRAMHYAIPNGYEDTTYQLQVKFRPQPLPVQQIYGLVLDSTAFITVTIKGNPLPRSEWLIESIAIPQGTRNGRYESYDPVDIGGGYSNVTLSIAGLTLEDTTKEYILKASNEFGITDYIVRISSSVSAPDTGLDIGSIIGIVVVSLVVVIAIILLIIARATGRWCFAGGTLRTDIGLDSEAQVANDYEDEKAHEEYHPQENGGGQPNSAEIIDEATPTAKHEPHQNGNSTTTTNNDVKTNTSV